MFPVRANEWPGDRRGSGPEGRGGVRHTHEGHPFEGLDEVLQVVGRNMRLGWLHCILPEGPWGGTGDKFQHPRGQKKRLIVHFTVQRF